MSATPVQPADLNNIQGDILSGLPKRTQTYFFFQIDDARVKEFRLDLAQLVPSITTTAQVKNDREKIAQYKKSVADGKTGQSLIEMSGVNIAFSQKGLQKLGINDKIGDSAFEGGMLQDSGKNLGDPGTTSSSNEFTPDWVPAFKKNIDGMILVSGSHHETVARKLESIEKIFGQTIHEVIRIVGDVRPGKEKGHEHFGFLDGISQPAVKDVDTAPNPGQETVRQGFILLGRDGDPTPNRPKWALDGSLLAFRYLFQLVPEFNTFLKENPISVPGLPRDQGSELLGARLVGRWKSGAPIDVAPTHDDPALGVDPARNNDFRYAFPDDSQTQDRCPFAAHTRKTNPRADLEDLSPPISTESRRIIRRGIQFGPEVTQQEAAAKKTQHGRGLLFAAYSSSIVNGFQFIQHSWANNTGFPIQKPITPGFDPIVGQASDPSSRTLSGTDPAAQSKTLPLPTQWVVPKGGEYFFSPSIPALKDTFALAAPKPHSQEL